MKPEFDEAQKVGLGLTYRWRIKQPRKRCAP